MPDSDTEDKQPKNDPAEEQVANSDARKSEDEPIEFVPEVNDEMAEALREKDQFKRLAQRAQADLVNYRRRIESEQESSRLRNQRRIVLRFADVIDQLDVAMKADDASENGSGWLEGITAIQKNFVNALEVEGFERFDCVGEIFDPRMHEALLSSATADYEPNTVVTELRPGYMHNGEVARPAQVQIAVELPADEESDEKE